MSQQLPLNIRLRDGSSFANFYPGRNKEALHHVETVARGGGDRVAFLWGGGGCGKTHLLQAACRAAAQQGGHAVYLPCDEKQRPDLEVLENIENASLVCFDDVDRIGEQPAWEAAMFALCERLRGAGGCLLAGARVRPRELGLELKDLQSRLGWGAVYSLHSLDDEEKIAAIRLRAGNCALEISDDAVRYILNRYPRDMHTLFSLLERIDEASLTQQRRVTVPFLRSLEQRSGD